jgi:geranylgeranyl diphosphate synthase type II
MIEGQAADVDGEQRQTDPELVQYIHQHKTAALLETCCRLGAICAGASTDALVALARYGRHLGLAFQIMDDILDLVSTGERMGKRVGKDAVAQKQTYPAAFGLEESKQQAWHEVELALRAIDSFGGRAHRLRDLARYVVMREK